MVDRLIFGKNMLATGGAIERSNRLTGSADFLDSQSSVQLTDSPIQLIDSALLFQQLCNS